MSVRVHISADGRGRAIYNKALEPYVRRLDCVKRRASHVEPVNFWQRRFFHLLRGCFGDDGHIAEWTRGWRCRWWVNMRPLGGVVYVTDDLGGPFVSRRKAIDFEIAILEPLIGRN